MIRLRHPPERSSGFAFLSAVQIQLSLEDFTIRFWQLIVPQPSSLEQILSSHVVHYGLSPRIG